MKLSRMYKPRSWSGSSLSMLQSLNTHLVNARSCIPVDEQGAFHELATIKAGENYFASKIKMLGLIALPPNDTFFRWSLRGQFMSCRQRSIRPRIPLSVCFLIQISCALHGT